MPRQRGFRKGIISILLILTFVALVAVVLLLMYFAPILGDQAQLYPSGPGSYLNTGNYKIDSGSIISSLGQGDNNVFSAVLATPETGSALAPGSFAWHELDYLKIAKALHQFVWKQPFDSWNLYSMQFKRGCKGPLGGFDSAEFTVYKAVEVNGQQVYTAHGVGIYPLLSIVSWGGDTNFPRPLIFGWQSIDIAGLKITADDALQIAEQNGGSKIRQRVNDGCRISARVSTKGWYVQYSGNDFSDLLEVLVDARTGKANVIKAQ